MKYFLIATVILCLVAFGPLSGQIQFEQSFDYSGSIVQLEDAGQKFMLMDVTAEQCRLYNSDYTLWKTVQFSVPNNQYLSDILQDVFQYSPTLRMESLPLKWRMVH